MTPAVRWEVVRTSTFRYPSPVAESQNELRACPTTDEVQALLHHRAMVEPGARVHAYLDYWGTRVETFGVRGPHQQLRVTAESSVVVRPRPDPPAEDVPRSALDTPAVRDEHWEVLAPTPLTDHVAADDAPVPDDGGVLSLATALCERVAERVAPGRARRPGGRSAAVAWSEGAGDAADRAHVVLALLRPRGVPARYVGGYLGGDGRTGAAHAWVEVMVPGHGWFALDPDGPVGRGHVVVGRARDRADLTPLRGTYVGTDEHEVDVDVRVTEVPEVSGPGARTQPHPRDAAQQSQQQQ